MNYICNRSTAFRVTLATALVAATSACGPDFQASANRLRRQTIAQRKQIDDLHQKLAARDATIRGLQSSADAKPPASKPSPTTASQKSSQSAASKFNPPPPSPISATENSASASPSAPSPTTE